ncbi:hypothetical protein PENSPDRAFT_626816 [Peniophora sp. CONT]|nr:hypothetical protein PENSPDRAFT_626816 [Peniophora sp. CONT]
MPLNYSKWDQLELSDDSDIEGHPNVDKKSLIRWKQRDIHEKRDQRNMRIQALAAEIDCNEILLARLKKLKDELSNTTDMPAAKRFSNECERLRVSPSPEAPPVESAQPVPYDEMIRRLLEVVATEAREDVDKAGKKGDEEKLGEVIREKLAGHIEKLGGVVETSKKEKDELEEEKKKTITMDDMHEGWDSKYAPAKPEPEPVVKPKGKGKEKKQTIETLNAPSSSSAPAPAAPSSSIFADEEDELPTMTPELREFAKLPLWDFQRSWDFIKEHRAVVVEGAIDALLVEAFEAESRGDKKLAKRAVHQSLLLQYGDKLGKDGLKLFFQRMIAGGQKAHAVFAKDVEDTYEHIARRVEITKEETANIPPGAEQIQLVAEHPGVEIHFNVPEGPPPENLILEGPGTEDLDIEEVRKALQLRWDIFSSFKPEMQTALAGGKLDDVNRELGKMSVEDAEELVGQLDAGGILSFAEGGIRDVTGEGEEGEEAVEEEAATA